MARATPLLLAPAKLFRDWRVPDLVVVAPAHSARVPRWHALGGMHRTCRTLGKPGSVIGMGVGDHDCRRIDRFLMVEPSRPTIDHYAHMAQPHQQGAVAKVAARPDLDLTAGA